MGVAEEVEVMVGVKLEGVWVEVVVGMKVEGV